MPKLFRRLLSKPRIWMIAVAFYWSALFVSTHLPKETPGLPGQGLDKLVHLAAFAVLTLLLATTWQLMAGRLTWRSMGLIWLVVVAYAAVDEWTQGFVGRHTSFGDWVADAVGAALGLVLFVWLRKRGQ